MAPDPDPTEVYWRRVLQGLTAPTPLVVGRPLVDGPSEAGHQARREIRLPAASTAGLEAFARAHGISLDGVVLGAWALLLHHYAGEDDMVFGVGAVDPLPRRDRPLFEGRARRRRQPWPASGPTSCG